jgi:hypothetical protein
LTKATATIHSKPVAMKNIVLFALVANLLACTTSPSPQIVADNSQNHQLERSTPGYKILKEGAEKEGNWLRLNEFFMIHYLYTDIFYRLGLHRILTLPDKIQILAGLLYNLDFENPVNLIVEEFLGSASLVVSVQLVRIGDQLSVLLATNTDREGKEIFAGVQNIAKTYKRSYVILEDQLIALTDLYSESKEAELIEENSADNLAQFYIFDGNSSNDTVAEGLLIGSIREAKNAAERSRSQLTLCRYYLSQNRLVEAQVLLLAVGTHLSQDRSAEQTLVETYSVTYEEFLITKALKDREARLQESRPKSL